jgi:glyoxylase-like metal-dependent hydrolase (beta-lactamase superfamily II)
MLTIKAFTFNAFQENTYVIYNEHAAAIIIDPGCYDISEQQVLQEFIQSNKLQVKRMLFTHAHIDHVLGAAFIEKTYGLRLIRSFNDGDTPPIYNVVNEKKYLLFLLKFGS